MFSLIWDVSFEFLDVYFHWSTHRRQENSKGPLGECQERELDAVGM